MFMSKELPMAFACILPNENIKSLTVKGNEFKISCIFLKNKLFSKFKMFWQKTEGKFEYTKVFWSNLIYVETFKHNCVMHWIYWTI